MKKAIATQFKNKDNKVDELTAQNKGVGQLAFLKFNNKVKILKKFCCSFNITKLAMPKIACGFDQLDWNIVFNIKKICV